MVFQLGTEKEFQVAVGAVVRSQFGSSAVLVEHVTLQVGGGGEKTATQVASERRTAGEGVLDEVGLQFERCIELATAQAARMQASFGQQVACHVRLDLCLGSKHLLTLDALVAPRLLSRQ